MTRERYVPAAGRAFLTRLYDPLMAVRMRERAFRSPLVDAVLADSRPRVVLDVGCGTGTLACQLAAADPSLEVLGIDGATRCSLSPARRPHGRAGEWQLIRELTLDPSRNYQPIAD